MTTAPAPQQNPTPEWTRRQRLAALALSLLIPAFFSYISIALIHASWPLGSGGNLVVHLFALLCAALLLTLAVFILVAPILRKLRTGHFLVDRAQAMQKRQQAFAKLGSGKPAGPQFLLWLLPAILSCIPLVFSGLIIKLAWCTCGHWNTGNTVGVALGAGFLAAGLIYPFVFIRRKLRTGYFLPSEEELKARRAKCGKPQPLLTRALLAGLMLLNAVLYTDSAISHMHRPHYGFLNPWFLAGTWCCLAVFHTWRLFRPSIPQCALPLDDTPLPTPTDDGPHFTLLDK